MPFHVLLVRNKSLGQSVHTQGEITQGCAYQEGGEITGSHPRGHPLAIDMIPRSTTTKGVSRLGQASYSNERPKSN